MTHGTKSLDRPSSDGQRRGLALVAAGALLAASIVWAGNALADRWHGWAGHGWFPGIGAGGLLFDQLDRDGDGRVARAEMEAYRTERWRSADGNGDGRLDQREFETFWLEVTRPVRVRAFQFLDADGDGSVTAVELQRPTDRLFSRLDRDGDGYLAPAMPVERERMRERREERGRGRD